MFEILIIGIQRLWEVFNRFYPFQAQNTLLSEIDTLNFTVIAHTLTEIYGNGMVWSNGSLKILILFIWGLGEAFSRLSSFLTRIMER